VRRGGAEAEAVQTTNDVATRQRMIPALAQTANRPGMHVAHCDSDIAEPYNQTSFGNFSPAAYMRLNLYICGQCMVSVSCLGHRVPLDDVILAPSIENTPFRPPR
jgi:hypothetical protein